MRNQEKSPDINHIWFCFVQVLNQRETKRQGKRESEQNRNVWLELEKLTEIVDFPFANVFLRPIHRKMCAYKSPLHSTWQYINSIWYESLVLLCYCIWRSNCLSLSTCNMYVHSVISHKIFWMKWGLYFFRLCWNAWTIHLSVDGSHKQSTQYKGKLPNLDVQLPNLDHNIVETFRENYCVKIIYLE